MQIVKKNGGENNLHYHTNAASFLILDGGAEGTCGYYQRDDVLIGEFGPHERVTITHHAMRVRV